MVENKECKKRLKECIAQDAKACRRTSPKPRFFGDEVWKFQLLLRKLEYYTNLTGFYGLLLRPRRYWCKYRFHAVSLKLGFSIPLNAIDKGLSIAHYGTIVINGSARIGKNCRMQEGINIGTTNGSVKAPVIGDNVFIGSGAKIIGDIRIADDVAIGAGAVVVKSIDEPGTTWGGVPARKISDNDSHPNLAPQLFE